MPCSLFVAGAKGEADVLLAFALNVGAGDLVLASELLYSALVEAVVALPEVLEHVRHINKCRICFGLMTSPG